MVHRINEEEKLKDNWLTKVVIRIGCICVLYIAKLLDDFAVFLRSLVVLSRTKNVKIGYFFCLSTDVNSCNFDDLWCNDYV